MEQVPDSSLGMAYITLSDSEVHTDRASHHVASGKNKFQDVTQILMKRIQLNTRK